MKIKFLALMGLALLPFSLLAQTHAVTGPDGNLVVNVFTRKGKVLYNVHYQDTLMLKDSSLGVRTSMGNFTSNLTISDTARQKIHTTYHQDRIKTSSLNYRANELRLMVKNEALQTLWLVFRVSNNDVGFRYELPATEAYANCIVREEMTAFSFPENTTTFLSPQATPGMGWKKTKPSYEEAYVPDEPLGTPSKYGVGYTFPALFHVGENGWVLVSETGVSGAYCGARLGEGTADGTYAIAYPQQGENNGFGSSEAILSLPGATPWRTLTVAHSLKPIVETTIPYDLVEPLFEPSQAYHFGRATWSWIMWQDNSMNYDDQVVYINLAAELGYEYILMDALWDTQIGYDKMPELIAYAQSKGVDVFLWYNSNGWWNNAPQGPRHKMHRALERKKEMALLQQWGVKGLKVDFFGGDKQETMQLYEDILVDANAHGLMIIFHGCTLPRGWERMYPNYVGSEAVLASENLIFTQQANDAEAYNACLHPFIRNAVGAMEFGPVLLNKRHNRTNNGGTTRKTSDIFQLATAVLYQNPVQMFALAPNNLKDVPAFEIDFMKQVPTTWDETIFLQGYPGKYCVLARRHANHWYVVGVNAQPQALELNLELPMLAGKKVKYYTDKPDRSAQVEGIKIKQNGKVKVAMQPNGGIILCE